MRHPVFHYNWKRCDQCPNMFKSISATKCKDCMDKNRKKLKKLKKLKEEHGQKI